MGRAPCCDKNKVKRGPWSPEEDTTLKNYVLKHGTGGNWIALPHKAGLKRCGKSCRLRWLNYLRPNIKHGGFTQEEDNLIIAIYSNIGSRWSVIASHLPGRTDNDIKNYWNTKLKKRLLASTGATSSTYSQNLSDFPTINNNMSTLTTSSSSPVVPLSLPPPLPSFYENSSTQLDVMSATTLTYPNIHGIVPEILPYEVTNYQDFPLPRLMEVQENGPSTNYYNVPCNFSPNSYTIYDPMSYANYASWSADYNGVAEEVGFLMELGSSKSSSYDLLDGFDNLSRQTAGI